ncbi:uncharacterized protein [Diabrotica undecimpunctata]|uniref:uncharacterized protein isoform X1 n=1 Tax=Diabrotica undecimpunctata TaxID=50387 RepID=UPI003B631F1F
MSDQINQNLRTETQQWNHFMRSFSWAASLQGGIAYFLMSIHAVNPYILITIFGFDPYYFLWVTMVYGLGIMILSRPAMRPISPVNRIAFGILGSLMFCHASRNCFDWLNYLYPERTYLRTFLGFFSGRIMMVHFLAYLYHVDTRTNIPGVHVHRDRVFEQMYMYP